MGNSIIWLQLRSFKLVLVAFWDSLRDKNVLEYKRKLARVSQVRKELKSRLQSLPDLSRLPNVTGSPVHLPFAGDVYSDD
ncbi:UNVERIFIED_CONTAM: Regulation of nuclear pre-mRNA domain-containing protein 1A [Gekko kuhli]